MTLKFNFNLNLRLKLENNGDISRKFLLNGSYTWDTWIRFKWMLPEMSELIIRGRIINFNMRINISPGKLTSTIDWSVKLNSRPIKPSRIPNNTATIVSTNNRFCLNQLAIFWKTLSRINWTSKNILESGWMYEWH